MGKFINIADNRYILKTRVRDKERMLVNENLNDYLFQFISTYNKKLTTIKISIVIPMYNEEKSIGRVISGIPKLPNYEIIVVDDGSTDNSRELAQKFDNVTLFVHENNMGYGKALLDGIFYASGDIIITLDSDGQHEPRDVVNLIKPIIENKADIAIGSRYMGNYYYKLPFSSRIGEAFIEFMLKVLFNVKVQNNQGGFRAFKSKTIHPLFRDIQFNGFEFATETIIRAKLKKYNIKEAPINVYGREYGKSRIKLMKLLFSLIHCLLHYTVIKFFGEKSLKFLSKLTEKSRISKLYS